MAVGELGLRMLQAHALTMKSRPPIVMVDLSWIIIGLPTDKKGAHRSAGNLNYTKFTKDLPEMIIDHMLP